MTDTRTNAVTEWAEAPIVTETLADVKARLTRIVEDALAKWDDFIDEPAEVKMGFVIDEDLPGLHLGFKYHSLAWTWYPYAWEMFEGQRVMAQAGRTPNGWDTYTSVGR